jgi:hypothetical protein
MNDPQQQTLRRRNAALNVAAPNNDDASNDAATRPTRVQNRECTSTFAKITRAVALLIVLCVIVLPLYALRELSFDVLAYDWPTNARPFGDLVRFGVGEDVVGLPGARQLHGRGAPTPRLGATEHLEIVGELPSPAGKIAVASSGRILFTFHPEHAHPHSSRLAEWVPTRLPTPGHRDAGGESHRGAIGEGSFRSFPSDDFQRRFYSVHAVRVIGEQAL